MEHFFNLLFSISTNKEFADKVTETMKPRKILNSMWYTNPSVCDVLKWRLWFSIENPLNLITNRLLG